MEIDAPPVALGPFRCLPTDATVVVVEDILRHRRHHPRAAKPLRDKPRDGQRQIADDLRIGAEPRAARQEPVRRIDGEGLRLGPRRLLVGVARHDGPDQPLLAPALRGKIDREPVEEITLERHGAAQAEIIGHLPEPLPKDRLPDPIHRDPRGQRRIGRHQPHGKPESVGRRPRGKWMERGGHVRGNGLHRLHPVAPVESPRGPSMRLIALGQMENGRRGLRPVSPHRGDRIIV